METIRIGLLGLGTVGGGVADILIRHKNLIQQRVGAEVRIVRAVVKHLKRKRSQAAAKIPLSSDVSDIIGANDIDIVVELVGGVEKPRHWVLMALKCRQPVVTANKALLAAHGTEIMRAADAAGVDIFFEAAVAGGIPIIRTLKDSLASDRILRITGILNGTTNFILDRMAEGQAYEGALKKAQELGFAEADPTLDVTGRDAADKLAILMRLAFGCALTSEAVPVEGITRLTPDVLRDADMLGFRVKLIAQGRYHTHHGKVGIVAGVYPRFVPLGHPLSTVHHAENAIAVESASLGTTLYQGQGAGALPTGNSVVSDIIEAARNLRAGVSGHSRLTSAKNNTVLWPAAVDTSAYYVRFVANDQPGVLAKIAKIFAANAISLANVMQLSADSGVRNSVPLVITTHPAPFGRMQKALTSTRKLKEVKPQVAMLRILGDD